MTDDQIQSEREERIAAAKRTRIVKNAIWTAVVIIVVAATAYGLTRYGGGRPTDIPGVTFPDQGQQHVPTGTQFEYNSNPPTSGPHAANPGNWGSYEREVVDQIAIHNLEHGGIWISYRPSVPSSAVAELKAIVDEFRGAKLIMAPRAVNDADVAVAAWRRLLKFNLVNGSVSEEQKELVRRFYKAFRDRGPEFVPGNMPGIDPQAAE